MRKTLFSIIALLLSLTASAETVTVTVGGSPVQAVVGDIRYESYEYVATLGNGYNACIPYWCQGELVIPGQAVVGGYQCRIEIGPVAFRFCTGLTSVKIEEGVTTIEAYAFVGCSNVRSIELPSTMTNIARGAFVNLKSLRIMTSHRKGAPIWTSNDMFSAKGTKASYAEMAPQRQLYVPMGAIESYKRTDVMCGDTIGWPDAFKRIYEINEAPQTIESLSEFQEFRDAVNSENGRYKGSSNRSVKLIADIDMSSVDNWQPIGTAAHPYNGVFDGGGHTISNLRVSSSGNDAGLFGYADSATIYNMYLQNPQVYGNDYVGTVLGRAVNYTRVSDVLVTSNASSGNDYTVKANNGSGGGIVGWARQSTIERCKFKGQVKCSGWAGGIVGNVFDSVSVADCSASNFIQGTDPSYATLGGIVGGAGVVTINRCYARNVLNRGDLALTYMGPILGKTNKSIRSTITNCVYWTNFGFNDPYFNYVAGFEPIFEGNRKFENEGDMYGANTKSTLGSENWYYFDRRYVDDPVPVTLKDMYIAACVETEDENGLVYRPVGDPITAYDIVGYKGHASSLTIPDTYKDKPVIDIEENVFRDNDSLRNITLGANLTFIGGHAFEDCDSLLAIDLPDAIDSIGEDAFASCESLASFNISKGLRKNANNFLARCPNLTTITATRGNDHEFACVDSMLWHSDPDTYTTKIIVCAPGKAGNYTIPVKRMDYMEYYIYDYAFAYCTKLTGITLPEENMRRYTLGKRLFEGADNLQYIDMYLARLKTDYTVCRGDTNSPFYGISENTVVYMPTNWTYGGGSTAPEDQGNAVIQGDAHSLMLNDGWDFNPPVDFTAANAGIKRELVGAETVYARVKRDSEGNIIYSDTKIPTYNEDGTLHDSIFVPQMETEVRYDPCIYPSCLPYDKTLTSEHAKVYQPWTMHYVDGIPTLFLSPVSNKEMKAYQPYYIVVDGDTAVSLDRDDSTAIAHMPDMSKYPYARSLGDDYEIRGTTVNIPGIAKAFRTYFLRKGKAIDDLPLAFHCYVRFIDPLAQDADSLICVETADYGGNVTPPEPPEHAGYTFTGWSSKAYQYVEGHVTVYAVYIKNTPTGVENTDDNTDANTAKLIRDGQMLIKHNGKTYTVTGQQVK